MPDGTDTSRMSVIKEIDRNEALVQDYLFQLDQIETKLRRSALSDSQREKLEEEVKSLKSQLDILEKELTGLRKENRKSMAIAGCLLLLFLIIYYFLVIKTVTG
ncbi:coiled-coil domain-containing protein 167-like [Haemaphysalis longicornis]